MSLCFSLDVLLPSSTNETTLTQLHQALDSDVCFVSHAAACRITQPQHEQEMEQPRWALVFCPATIVDSALEQQKVESDDSAFIPLATSQEEARLFSERLLAMIHLFLARNFPVKAVISIRNKPQPADLVLLDLAHTPQAAIADLLEQTNGQTLHSGPEDAVLKILLVSKVNFELQTNDDSSCLRIDIPTCPVCLHRIAPWRLGLPPPGQVCSQFCPPPNLLTGATTCPRQRLLKPWPLPARCPACAVIDQYWKNSTTLDTTTADDLFCYSCALQETLWVCLTCAFVGCGRYSNKHAEQHYRETGHPYCLELSTLRIWGYVQGEFVHRVDLLACPSCPPLQHPWIPQSLVARAAAGHSSHSSEDLLSHDAQLLGHFHHNNDHVAGIHPLFASLNDEKSPKKANMIGEEYEALLQSALEEQAQHYEGEISRLHADLTAQQVDTDSISQPQRDEIEHYKLAISESRTEIDQVGRQLLDLQAQEAGHRAVSQRLLREQQVMDDVLNKLKQEIHQEQAQGRKQVDELEQQIADLTANQRMRHQFSQDQELLNAQIFGAIGTEKPSCAKKGKKSRRFFRK